MRSRRRRRSRRTSGPTTITTLRRARSGRRSGGASPAKQRTNKDGTKHFVYQCNRCGKTGNQAISEAKAYELNGGNKPPPLDESRWKKWNAAKLKEQEEAEVLFRGEADAEYSRYLASPEWAAKRRLVLKRAGGLCEGCGIARATDAHHLTYDHKYEELLFELVAVCRPCHMRAHPEKSVPEKSE